MFGYDWPRVHALVVSFPVALLTTAVFFELAALVLKKEGLRRTGFALLLVGTVSAAVAVLLGLQAEDAIQHGPAIHRLMEEHEELAYFTLGIFSVVALWRLVRERRMGTGERIAVFVLSLAGFGFLADTGHHGGKMVFEHAAGVPDSTLAAELRNRREGHVHGAGEAADHHDDADDHDHGPEGTAPADSGASAAPATNAAGDGHTHAPGTPPHKD